MPFLTPDQLHLVRNIVRKHHTAIIASVFGPESLSPDEVQQLELAGILEPKLAVIDEAYSLGHVIGIIDGPKAASMSLPDFRDYLESNPIELTDAENRAVTAARGQAAEYVRGLSSRVERETGRILSEAEQRDAIRTKTATAIEQRKTIGRLKTELGKITKDYDRDWHRVAITELQGARQRGQADRFRSKFGEDSWVFKRTLPGACRHCLRLHNGADGMPRLFRLKDLEANGTNVGRKAADWKAVVQTLHPFCSCELVAMPDGWGFNEEGDMDPEGTFGVRHEAGELERSLELEDEFRKSQRTRGKVEFQGLTIAIENPVGSIRRWATPEGLKGETVMRNAYGYLEGTRGTRSEGMDEYDVFLGSNPLAPFVFVVHQHAPPDFDKYDEDKSMIGFSSIHEARQAYLVHYDDDRFLGSMSQMPIEEFREKVMMTRQKIEDGMVKASEFSLVVPEMRQLPRAEGAMIWQLEKAMGHKYVKRTGVPGNYTYFYQVPGKPGLVPGSKPPEGTEPHEEVHPQFTMKVSDKKPSSLSEGSSGEKTTPSLPKKENDSGGENGNGPETQYVHTVKKKFPDGPQTVSLKREGGKWHVSWKGQEALFSSVSAAAKHVFVNTKGYKDVAAYRAAGKVPPGVSWNLFGIKDRRLLADADGPKKPLEKKSGPENERLQLGNLGGIEGAAKLQTFRTKAEARAAAGSIGWPGGHAQPHSLGSLKLPGWVQLGKWTLVEGDGKALSRDAFVALQAVDEKSRTKPEKLEVEKQEKAPPNPDALPPRSKGGLGAAIDQIVSASGLDLGTVDVQTAAFYEHFSDKHSGIVKDSKVKRIIDRSKEPSKTVRDLMIETLRAITAKSWRDIGREDSIKGETLIEYFSGIEELEQIRLPSAIDERHLVEDQYASWAAAAEDRKKEKEDERELTEEEAKKLEDDAFDFDPAMFKSMLFAHDLRPVSGTRRAFWRDASGETWLELNGENSETMAKSDLGIVRVPTLRSGKWRTRYFQKSGLLKQIASSTSKMGNRAVVTGGRGFDIQHHAQMTRKAPFRAEFDPIRDYLKQAEPMKYMYRDSSRVVTGKDKTEWLGIDGRYLQPLSDKEYIDRYNQITKDVLSERSHNVDRVRSMENRRLEAMRQEDRSIKKSVTVRKKGLGRVTLRFGNEQFEVEVPGEDGVSFSNLSSACDYVWAKQKGYDGAEDYKSKESTNKVPSGAGWRFWGISAT